MMILKTSKTPPWYGFFIWLFRWSPSKKEVPFASLTTASPKPRVADEINLFTVTETDSLAICAEIEPLKRKTISEKVKRDLFADYRQTPVGGGAAYTTPAIDKEFAELLLADVPPSACKTKVFRPKKFEWDPFSYFWTLRPKMAKIAMPACDILQIFVENPDLRAKRNWFVLNTKPGQAHFTTSNDDLRIVGIYYTEDGKYVIATWRCNTWGNIGGGLPKKEIDSMRFFARVS